MRLRRESDGGEEVCAEGAWFDEQDLSAVMVVLVESGKNREGRYVGCNWGERLALTLKGATSRARDSDRPGCWRKNGLAMRMCWMDIE